MTDVDSHTLRAIAASAEAAAVRAGLGDRTGADAALDRAERQLGVLSAGKPAHARVVRLAREAVEKARGALALLGPGPVTRRAAASIRRTSRAAARAKA